MVNAHCKFYQFGHCRYGDLCRKEHVKEACETENCQMWNCMKRHPRECKFFKEFHRCKFGDYCNYAHLENSSAAASEAVKAMAAKIEILEKENVYIKKKIEELDVKNGTLVEKLKTLEDRLSEVITVLECTDEEDSEDETDKEHCVQEELRNLIAESQQKRDVWEMTRTLTPENTSLEAVA